MQKIVFHHIRKDKNQPRGQAVTVAMEVNEQKEVVGWATAKCHPKDNFCKHTGRVKSAGRLNSLRHRQVCNGTPIKEFLTAFTHLVDL